MSTARDREELLRLVDRLVSETITPEEHVRLDALLQESAEARKVFFAYVDLDLGLRQLELIGSGQIPPPVGMPAVPLAGEPLSTAHVRRRWPGYVAVALTLAASLWLGPWLWRSEPHGATRELAAIPEPVEYVATLLFAGHCRWAPESGPLLEGQRLPRKRLHLEQGLAVVRFDGKAVAILADNVKLDLESRGSVRVHFGRITVRANGEAQGFTVLTPTSDVVDLGTEFSVEVAPDGATEVHVLQGAVECRKPRAEPQAGRMLKEGEAARFDSTQKTARPIALRANRFDELLRQATPRPRKDRLLAYEGFNYPPGQRPPAATNGGKGWAGPWRLRSEQQRSPRHPDTFAEMRIASQQLTIPWPIQGGRAGMLEMPPGGCYRLRPLAQAIDLGKDAVYYVSLMVREELSPESDPRYHKEEVARLTFRSSEDYWGPHVALGLPPIGRPQIGWAVHLTYTAPAAVPRGQTMLWVAKILARREGPDEVYFRIYHQGEALDVVEPADWSVTASGLKTDARLDLVVLTSDGRGRHWFDELRIGTNWRAVVPIAQPTRLPAQTR